MTAEKQAAVAAIEKKADLVAQVADEIWSFAELSLQEEQSADLYCRVLEQEGFKVERGICNIPTAFSASYGSGRPIIGLLAEYDALSGLSQKGGSLTREELVSGGCGHGCGHNLLGAGAMAAALGVKAYLEAAKIPGTVVLYGCPGEEGGAAKAFMARDGLWYGLDAALTWHPDDANEVLTGSSNSCIQTQYHFTGVAAHAAGDPDRGRSALDAVGPRKRQTQIRAARAWLAAHDQWHLPCRFDLVCIEPGPTGPHMEHIRHAFDLSGSGPSVDSGHASWQPW